MLSRLGIGNNPAHRQIALLAACQALLLTNAGTLISVNVLAGLALSGNPAWATLPVTCYVLGSALSTMMASLVMRRIGRRGGFTLGGLFGILGALMCAGAMALHSFVLLCLGTMVIGVYNAFGQYYRFAAADVTQKLEPRFKERAIALVLTGGVVGGIIGPETSMRTVDALPITYMGSYLMLIVFALIAIGIVRKLDVPMPTEQERSGAQRPFSEIARQPAFIVAVLGAMISYGIMNLLMSATPLAMLVCGHTFQDSAFVLEWHIIGMFLPGLFTGGLIRRHGVLTIMMTGVLLLVACACIAMTGVSVTHFWASSALLGVGWNFIFIGATTLLTETYRPAEKAKVQGLNESLVFLTMISSSLSSGAMFSASGWNLINLYALPVLTVLGCAILALGWQRRKPA